MTPNMSLSLPAVSSTLGPAWATMLNAAMELVDAHDHTSGKGVQVPSVGLNINADLPFNSKNATGLRSSRFTSQGSPLALGTDLNCLYVSGGNLYYNDGVGNQVRLTVGGAIDTSTSGTITGMGATTASVTYSNVSKIFTFLQNTGVPAKINAGSYLLSPDAATTYAITLTADASIAASYTLTLPAALPASTKIVTVTSSGTLAFVYDVDGSTLEVASNTLRIKDNGVTTAKIVAGAVTRAKLEALGQQLSSSCGNFTNSSGSATDITNLTVTITTTGRPVFLAMIADGSDPSTTPARIQISATQDVTIRFVRSGTTIAGYQLENDPGDGIHQLPVTLVHIDTPAAGTYTYKMQVVSNNATLQINYYKLMAYEL